MISSQISQIVFITLPSKYLSEENMTIRTGNKIISRSKENHFLPCKFFYSFVFVAKMPQQQVAMTLNHCTSWQASATMTFIFAEHDKLQSFQESIFAAKIFTYSKDSLKLVILQGSWQYSSGILSIASVFLINTV